MLGPSQISGQHEAFALFVKVIYPKVHPQKYRYIPSSFRDITESNFNGSPDIRKKSPTNCHFIFT